MPRIEKKPDPSAPLFEVSLDVGGGCRLWGDGEFETFGGYTPDAAAREFWAAIASAMPAEFRRAAEEVGIVRRGRLDS